MKLNPDCIRAILLAVEDSTDFHTHLVYARDENVPKRWAKFDHDEIIYHVRQCYQSGLVADVRYYSDADYIEISDLSPAGHQFLANVRQDNIWNSTKEIAAKVGSKSLDTLIQISSSVITELIKSHLGLTGHS